MLSTHFRVLRNIALGFLLTLCTSNVIASKFTLLGRTAQATWVQQNGCIQTQIFVIATEATVKEQGEGGPIDTPTNLFVGIDSFNMCAGTFTSVQAEGRGDFTMTALNEARVRGTLPGQQFTSDTSVPAEVVVDVMFVGVGDVIRTFSIFRQLVSSSIRSRAQGTSQLRDAATTGSVRLNGVETLTGSSTDGFLLIESQATFQRGSF